MCVGSQITSLLITFIKAFNKLTCSMCLERQKLPEHQWILLFFNVTELYNTEIVPSAQFVSAGHVAVLSSSHMLRLDHAALHLALKNLSKSLLKLQLYFFSTLHSLWYQSDITNGVAASRALKTWLIFHNRWSDGLPLIFSHIAKMWSQQINWPMQIGPVCRCMIGPVCRCMIESVGS